MEQLLTAFEQRIGQEVERGTLRRDHSMHQRYLRSLRQVLEGQRPHLPTHHHQDLPPNNFNNSIQRNTSITSSLNSEDSDDMPSGATL